MRWKGEKCFIVALFEFDLVLVIKVRAFLNGIFCLECKSLNFLKKLNSF